MGPKKQPVAANSRVSPYISSIVQISSNDSTLSIHHSTLEPYPKLLSMIQTARATRLIRLNVSGKTARVIVHFMYTGSYEHLPFDGSDPQEWQHSEFATCLECYAAALEYGLNDLVPLMQKKLKRLGTDIAISKFIAIVEDIYPRSISSDNWFSSFVDDCVQQAFNKFNVRVDEKTLGELEERKTYCFNDHEKQPRTDRGYSCTSFSGKIKKSEAYPV